MPSHSASLYQAHVSSLLDHSQSEFNELFSTLPAPKLGELNGCYKGSLLAIIGLNWLPRFFRTLLYRTLQTFLNPWAGKRFDDKEGANYWFTQSGKSCFGYYKIEDDQKGADGLPLTLLSYDVDKNLGILRPVRGEVRKINDGLFLARMLYKTSNKMVQILYFTLEKNDD